MTDQPRFTYWECGFCGFDAVTMEDFTKVKKPPHCPLCAGDNGLAVDMSGRVAQDTDIDIEGRDARVVVGQMRIPENERRKRQ